MKDNSYVGKTLDTVNQNAYIKNEIKRRLPQYRDKTIDAMAEAKRISRDPEVKGYNSIEELKAALDD